MLWLPRQARIRGSQILVSLSLRLKDLLGPVTRVKKKKGVGDLCDVGFDRALERRNAFGYLQSLLPIEDFHYRHVPR